MYPFAPIMRVYYYYEDFITSCPENHITRIRVTFALPLPHEQIAERQQDYFAVLLDWSYPPARQSQSNHAEYFRQFRLLLLLRNRHPRG